MDFLEALYRDPREGFVGVDKLYKKAKLYNKNITKKRITDWFAKHPELRQFSDQKDKFDGFKIASENPNSWQMDLTFRKTKRDSKGSSVQQTVLTAININSRIAYALLIKDKTADVVLKAMKQFVKAHNVQIITTDNGTEFMNNKAQDWFKSVNIEHYNNEAGDHNTMGKIERFNRTLKQRLMRMKPNKLTQKILTDLIDNYNNTYHRMIKATPNEMQGKVIESDSKHNQKVMDDYSNHFSIGTRVIVKLHKNAFGKEGERWGKAVYEVVDIDGFKLHLRSKNGHVLYKSGNDVKIVEDEPTIVKIDTTRRGIWEVEKILKHARRSNGKFKYLIKWENHEEPTWEPQGNLRLVQKNRMSRLERDYFKSKGLENLIN
jgi:hypothetical protein